MLDPQTMIDEYAKSFADKTRIFFIEKYFTTFNATKGKKSPFVLFPRQKAFLHSVATEKASVAIKPRQAGITTTTSAWAAAQIVFASPERPETVLCVGNKLDISCQLLSKIKEFLLQVPRWYWGEEYYSPDPKAAVNKKDIFLKNSKQELVVFNGCSVYARSSGENATRGIPAVSILIFDEAAFIADGKAVYAAAAAATASCPYAKTVMVSTPNGKDELYYETYRQALDKKNNFNAVEFKWFQDPRYNKNLRWYRKNEKTGEYDTIIEEVLDKEGSIKYDEERWRKFEQDGWKPTSPWYEDMCRQFNNDPIKIAQELDVSFLGSANNVVSPELIQMQETMNVREPLTDLVDPLVEETWFWKAPIEGHRYIMGIDPSRGVSADQTAIEIVDMDGVDENGMPIIEQVMEYIGRKLGDDIGAMAVSYAHMYNDAYVVVDCTGGQGDACVLTMLNMGYTNMYYEDNEQKNYTRQHRTYSQQQYDNTLPGFHFQGNRYVVLNNFAGMVRNNEFKIRSHRVITELDTWVFTGANGRMDHQGDSNHDDSICALAMALFVMKYSYQRAIEGIKKDKAILTAYKSSSNFGYSNSPLSHKSSVSLAPKKYAMPFYRASSTSPRTIKAPGAVSGSYMWLLGGHG